LCRTHPSRSQPIFDDKFGLRGGKERLTTEVNGDKMGIVKWVDGLFFPEGSYVSGDGFLHSMYPRNAMRMI